MQNYKHFGVMIDCSRNAVMTVQTVKKMMDYLAKMGYNSVELYTEDTYEVEGEEYFGYLRGRYSVSELKELDAYAQSKGIELIPCIQTLAHFPCLMNLPHYADINDTGDILLVDEEKTYVLLEKIFSTLAKSFTSRNVNIGMDEAHFVGLGKYLDKHGYGDRNELLLRHLKRVTEIAVKYGFKPHMWSDMFFRLAGQDGYYGKEMHIDENVRAKVPKEIALTYWDYYHDNQDDYDAMFASHFEFNREVWFAGGAWCWNGFAPFNWYSLKTMLPAMKSVRKYGVENVMITLWGDNGSECSYFSTLPALYAIRRYADGEFDREKIKAEFFELFGLKFDDFMALDLPNIVPSYKAESVVSDPCKSLLYSDCLMGIFDADLQAVGSIPYGEYAKTLGAFSNNEQFGYIFDYLSKLCHVLEIKYDLGNRTRAAYLAKDKKALKALAQKDYAEVLTRLDAFYESFRTLWMKENKPFGFEIQDARLGGLMLRVKNCKREIEEYCDGKLEKIAELEEKILPFCDTCGGLQMNGYAQNISTSLL